MQNAKPLVLALACSLSVAVGQSVAAQAATPALLIPHATWDCGMPAGIVRPEAGTLVFEIEMPLERAVDIGQTPYGKRRVGIGLEGSIEGPRLSGTVSTGGLDFELTLANGTIEIEQALVLRASDGSYLYARNAGTGADAADVRIVVDLEAPNDGPHAWLNSRKLVARRELDAATNTLRLEVYDVSSVVVGSASATSARIAKPAGVAPQPWGYRDKNPNEQPGEVLITENVTLAPSQTVGESKRGNRNIIPITGGTLRGRITGNILLGGADYQLLTPPATIDAHYLWQTDDGETIIVRNGGSFGALVPTFETRVDGPYAYLHTGRYLSSNPGRGEGGVAITFYESAPSP